jgi:hypothetical protein
MHAKVVLVYHQSLWFWLQRILFIAFVASISVCISQAHAKGAIVASLFFMSLGAISSFGMLALDPLAVEIHPDFFTLRFLWKRQKYLFANVNYITRGQVLLPRAGILETVKVGFRSGHPLQLKFPAVREKLYRALITAWHSATDDPHVQHAAGMSTA